MADFTLETSNAELPAEEDFGGTYEHNPNHVTEAVGHLIEFFRQPRNSAIVSAVNAQHQEIEDALWALYQGILDVDTSVGDALDNVGKIVGERRSGRSDDDFRAAIRVRQLINRANGTIPEFNAIIAALLPLATFRVRDVYPAAMVIEVDDITIDPDLFVALMREVKPAGVRLHVVNGLGSGGSLGAADGSPLGGVLGAVDGTPLGFVLGSGT